LAESAERQALRSAVAALGERYYDYFVGQARLTREYGVASLLALARTTRIAPVSREMILNFVAQTSLGLPKSY